MIRTIIFAVFVVPVISLVLDKTQKATKKEKFTNTVFVSHYSGSVVKTQI